MPQERSDARKLERELKVPFEWLEADKSIEREERNKPLDLNSPNSGVTDLLALESRSWRTSGGQQAPAGDRRVHNTHSQHAPSAGRRRRPGGNRPSAARRSR